MQCKFSIYNAKKAIRRIFNTQYNERAINYFMEQRALGLLYLPRHKTDLLMHRGNTILLAKNVQNPFVHMYGQVHTRQNGNFLQFDVGRAKK